MAPKRRRRGRIEANESLAGDVAVHRQIAYLQRSREWGAALPRAWKPRKVLGAGGNGVCSLFEYTGNVQGMPRKMVIKQSDTSLREEGIFLHKFADLQSEHVIKIYKDVYSEGGTGSSPKFDCLPFTQGVWDPNKLIDRMYIEYCEGGDLHDAMQLPDMRNVAYPVPEEFVWRIFECLARSLLIMEFGTENPMGQPWLENPVAHFDIKPANILLGEHDEQDHSRLPIFKLADFGLALQEPNDLHAPHWISHAQWRATYGYMSPEQLYPMGWPPLSRTIGHWSNIWSSGAVIYELMTKSKFQQYMEDPAPNGDHLVVQQFFETRTTILPEFVVQWGVTFNSCGEELNETAYSKTLIELVHRCLARVPADRPSPQHILAHAQRALTTFDEMNEDILDFENVDLGYYAGYPPLRPRPPRGYTVLTDDEKDTPAVVHPQPLIGRQPILHVPHVPQPPQLPLIFPPHAPLVPRPPAAWPWTNIGAAPGGVVPPVAPVASAAVRRNPARGRRAPRRYAGGLGWLPSRLI